MSVRQIVLDTETTGLRVEDGHRIIEIGCVELIDRKLTGKNLHYYLNPERLIDEGALAIHGITNQFLQDKPIFNHIANDFIDFIQGSELIIHNASFDLAFIENELMLTQQKWPALNTHCRIIDTLQIARQLHAGQKNSLDALCKRYGVDNSKRELHGALLDAHLLAQVYLAMTGGQGSFFDALNSEAAQTPTALNQQQSETSLPKLLVLRATEEECLEHQKYLEFLKLRGECVWLDNQ